MTAREVLGELTRRGVRARVVGTDLRLAPAEAIDAGLLEEAKRVKPELVRLLSEWSTPATCSHCGETVLPYLLVKLDGTRAATCPRGHWTPARREAS